MYNNSDYESKSFRSFVDIFLNDLKGVSEDRSKSKELSMCIEAWQSVNKSIKLREKIVEAVSKTGCSFLNEEAIIDSICKMKFFELDDDRCTNRELAFKSISPIVLKWCDRSLGIDESVDLGYIGFKLKIDSYERELKIKAYAAENNIYIGGFFHPHITDSGNFCFGGFAISISEALSKLDFAEIDRIIYQLITNYNNDSVHVHFGRFESKRKKRPDLVKNTIIGYLYAPGCGISQFDNEHLKKITSSEWLNEFILSSAIDHAIDHQISKNYIKTSTIDLSNKNKDAGSSASLILFKLPVFITEDGIKLIDIREPAPHFAFDTIKNFQIEYASLEAKETTYTNKGYKHFFKNIADFFIRISEDDRRDVFNHIDIGKLPLEVRDRLLESGKINCEFKSNGFVLRRVWTFTGGANASV